MEKIILSVEQNQTGHYWGIVESLPNFMLVGEGVTLETLIQDVKDGIQDYQEHEGKDDPFWGSVDLSAVEFEIVSHAAKSS